MVENKSRRAVRKRAGGRCEYCRFPEELADVPFHVEHIVARQHGGVNALSNLALACDRCNLQKGPNLTTVDETTGQTIELFHPRKDAWTDHFAFRGPEIVGLTPTGQATARLLKMNAPRRLAIRAQMLRRGVSLY
jgi:hypothetical protein